MASLTFGNSLSNAMSSKINPKALSPLSGTPSWQQTLSDVQNEPKASNATSLPSSYNSNGGMSKISSPSNTSAPISGMKTNTTAPVSNDASKIIGILGQNGTNPLSSSQTAAPMTGMAQSPTNQPSTTVPPPSTYNSSVQSLGNQSGSAYNTSTTNSIGGLQGIANTPNSGITTAQNGLQGIAQNESPEVTQARDRVRNLEIAQNDIRNNPNVAAEVSVGRGNALAGLIGAEQTGYQNALSAQGQKITAGNDAGTLAATGQGQQITAAKNAGDLAQTGQTNAQNALTSAGNLSQPVSNAAFFGSPETGNVVGNGGGGTGNQLIDNAVSNAVQQIKNGSSTQDAMATLNGLGQPAQQALINEMRKYDPNWNITASNAIAQQNMKQGQDYQAQATQLSTTLQQLDKLTPTVTEFINKSGLNSEENPFFNKSINTYSAQLKNPADVASLNAMMADVKTYTAQILGSSGLNPTEVSATVNSFDPSMLNGSQLTSFLSNLKNLGQTRLQPLQESSKSSYTGGSPFMGGVAAPSTSSSYGPENSDSTLKNNNPVIQGLIGGGMQAVGGIEGLISGIASKILR